MKYERIFLQPPHDTLHQLQGILRVAGYLGSLRPFNSISVISARWKGDNESLCVMEPLLRLKNFHLQRVSTLGPLDQQASALRTELSEHLIIKENSERLGPLEVKNTPRNTSARTNTVEL